MTTGCSYATFKDESSAEFARKVILETFEHNNGNVEKTARQVGCSKNTIYLALKKREEGCLGDKPHKPLRLHPRKTKDDVIEVILSRRAETGFGKRRLRWYVWARDGFLIPESTIGKILRDRDVVRNRSRVRRESHRPQYRWDKLVPFEENQMDTKEIADKDTLPSEVYRHIKESEYLPGYQWTWIDVVSRLRFLAWSYSLNWSCGQVFGKMVVWWLRLHGIWWALNNQSDGGTEFNAAQENAFRRTVENFWHPLGVERRVIRKGHPEDNAFVERSHQTDDYEFYIPYLLQATSLTEFLKLGGWWIKVGNLYRPHQSLNNLTPYERLRSFGYTIPPSFSIFPPLILDHLVALNPILQYPSTVQDHIDYDQSCHTNLRL